MMNKTAQAEFDRITAIPDLAALTEKEIDFLKARRAYLTPTQRLAYKPLNLFPKDEAKSQSIDGNKPNINDLTEDDLDNLGKQDPKPKAPEEKSKEQKSK